MGRADYLALGDWNVVCFECGHKRKASQTVRNWQGYYVCPEHNEPRQPQDFVRGVPDNQTAPWVQPAPAVTYVYNNTFLGLGDGINTFFQLGDGLYTTYVTNASVNGSPVTYTDNGVGGISLDAPAPINSLVTASGTETMVMQITLQQTTPPGTYTINPSTPVEASFSITGNNNGSVNIEDTTTNAVGELWDFGDGSTVTSMGVTSHVYTSSGTYTITLNAFGGDGSSSSATQSVVITIPIITPTPPGSGLNGQTVTLTGTLSDSTPVSISATPGQRMPLVSGKIIGSLMYHADGLSVCIENCYAGTTQDLTGTFTLTAGSTQIFTGELTIWAYSRTRPFWLTAPTPIASPDLSLFPTLGSAPAASMYAQYEAADNSVMGIGCDIISIGNTGEYPHLGPVPQWDACYLTNPSSNNLTVVRGMSDASAVWPYHVIDPATNSMLLVSDYPQASMLPAVFQANNPIVAWTTACKLNLGQAQGHATNRCSLACALYGTAYDKEELSLWNNYVNCLWQNPGYRLPAGCCNTSHGELPRSIGRGLTVMLYAAKFSDHTNYFDSWVTAYGVDLATRFLGQSGIHVDQLALVYPNNGFAPWQNHIMIYGVGLAVKFGYTTNYQNVLDYMAVTLLDSILVTQHEFATLYSVSSKDASGLLAPDWKTALSDEALFNAKVAKAAQCAENSLALRQAMAEPDAMTPGDFDGHPASPTGYCSMARPGIVMVAVHGTDQTRAQAALTVLNAHDRANYTQNPKYYVIG